MNDAAAEFVFDDKQVEQIQGKLATDQIDDEDNDDAEKDQVKDEGEGDDMPMEEEKDKPEDDAEQINEENIEKTKA